MKISWDQRRAIARLRGIQGPVVWLPDTGDELERPRGGTILAPLSRDGTRFALRHCDAAHPGSDAWQEVIFPAGVRLQGRPAIVGQTLLALVRTTYIAFR